MSVKCGLAQSIPYCFSPIVFQVNIHADSRAFPLINARVIENTFDLKLPLLYKKLENDGMLQYSNMFGSDWYSKVYPTLKNQPPLLLFAQNFELMSVRDVYEELREMQSYTHWLPDFKMIPFAGDGSGDRYAFYDDGKHDEANNSEPVIIHWWHDSDHCDTLAKNLQDFIFIKMLCCALEMDAENDLADDGEITINLNNMLATHSKYLTLSQAAVLKQIYSRAFNEIDGILSAMQLPEYQQILLQEIGYCENLGSFAYTKY